MKTVEEQSVTVSDKSQPTQSEPLMNIKTIVMLVVLFILGILGAYVLGGKKTVPSPVKTVQEVPTPIPSINEKSTPPPEVLNTKLYFQAESAVYELSPLGGDPKIFIEAEHYAFSPDFKKVAYIKSYQLPGNFFILDLETQQTKAYKEDTITKRGLEWSPDGKYILVNIGTGPDGLTAVYEVESGDKIGEFAQIGQIIWKDNETFFLGSAEKVNEPRPWGGGDGLSIVKRNITTNNVETILKADETTDYYTEMYKDNCLYFTKTHVDDPADWADQLSAEKTNYCYNVETTNQTEVAEEELLLSDVELYKMVTDFFNTTPERRIPVKIIKNKDIDDWVIASPYSGGSVYDSAFYILNIQDIGGTALKLGQGASITWIKK